MKRASASAQTLIARRQSYHGNTLGALSAGGNVFRFAQNIPPPALQTHAPNRTPATIGAKERMAKAKVIMHCAPPPNWKSKILQLGAENVALVY